MAATVPTIPLNLDVATLARVVLRPEPGFTEDDFFDFCQEHDLLRIERNAQGEIIIMAPVGTEGGFIESLVYQQFSAWAETDKRGIAFSSNTGVTLPDTSVLSPDAFWISRTTWKTIPRKDRKKFAHIVPAFVIEVRSPSDRMKDLKQKMLVYIRNGVELGWLIDPDSKKVFIYKSGSEIPVELNDSDQVDGEGSIAGFVLNLREIYQQLES